MPGEFLYRLGCPLGGHDLERSQVDASGEMRMNARIFYEDIDGEYLTERVDSPNDESLREDLDVALDEIILSGGVVHVVEHGETVQ